MGFTISFLKKKIEEWEKNHPDEEIYTNITGITSDSCRNGVVFTVDNSVHQINGPIEGEGIKYQGYNTDVPEYVRKSLDKFKKEQREKLISKGLVNGSVAIVDNKLQIFDKEYYDKLAYYGVNEMEYRA